MAATVLASDQGAVRILTLNRPERLNALDTPARRALAAHLAEAQAADTVRALILTGAGERAFCAGQDLHEGAGLQDQDAAAWMASWKGYFAALSRFTKPIVVAVNGVAAGAGFQTALMGDLRLAAPSARFIMAEVDVGLPAITGGHLLQLHLGLSRAVELVLSGRAVAAAEAQRIGLVNEVVPADRLIDRALAVAGSLADKPPVAMRLNLERFRALLRADLEEAEDAAVAYQSEAVATGEPQRAMEAFLAARAVRRQG
jgi:enoyl-CoA hydratase/carnithine racemase